jgi:arylsulfatase A-like enzyme
MAGKALINRATAFTLTVMIRKVLAGVSFALLSLSVAAAASKPNLVLITVDSARPDRMGFLGAKGPITPNLDHLAGEAIVFDHAYAQAPSGVVSHATILSGAYPQSTGMSEIGGTLPSSLLYLPDQLKSQGYHTAAFVGSIDLDPQNGLAQGFDRGFQTYDAGFRPAIPGDARPPVTERRGAEVVARATAWIDHNSQGQFFLWVNISDANAPSASYNSAITAADAAIGKLISALQQRKLYSNTAVIVAASHGASLGAHGEEGHGIFLYDETIHVPLLIKLPETQPAAKPARVTAKVRLVDIAPTLLEIAAIPVPSQMLGQSLLRVAKAGGGADQPAYSRTDLPQRGFGWSPLESWRASKYLYIRAPKPELYDLTADPGATHNLAQSFQGHARHAGRAARQLRPPLQRRGRQRRGGVELRPRCRNWPRSDTSACKKSSCAAAATVCRDRSQGQDRDRQQGARSRLGARPVQACPRRRQCHCPHHCRLDPIVAADPEPLPGAVHPRSGRSPAKPKYAEAAKHLHKGD